MANHLRRQLREAAALALTGLATSGTNVFPSRTHELQDAQLPALRIYTNAEQIEKLHGHTGGEQERALQLMVECCAKAGADLDDTLDGMIKEVEIAIAGAQTLAGAQYIDLKEIEVEMLGEAEREVGVARMTFEAVLYADMAAPDVAL